MCTVAELLNEFSGDRVYFEASGGNNGDDLIRMGSELALSRAGMLQSTSLENADVIVIRGGGSMNDFSASGLTALRRLLSARPNCPLIVLPQSYIFDRTDFGALFCGRSAPVYLFARERVSLGVLKSFAYPPQVQLGIDHDMALRLRGSPFIEDLLLQSAKDHVLIAERGDEEATTGAAHKAYPFGPIKLMVPQQFRMKIKRALRRRSSASRICTRFAEEMLGRAALQNSDINNFPVIASDVSDRGSASFAEFCELITRAALIATNRLHVGLLGALLGKQTLLQEASYHKLRGVYEYSLADMPHVKLVS